MKKDKFCINRMFLLLFLLFLSLIGAFYSVNKLNKSNFSTNSKAAEVAYSQNCGGKAGQNQRCCANDTCINKTNTPYNQQFQCYGKSLATKSCVRLVDVCGTLGGPCCDTSQKCKGSNLTCSTEISPKYNNPWLKGGTCVSMQKTCGGQGEECCGSLADPNRCDSDSYSLCSLHNLCLSKNISFFPEFADYNNTLTDYKNHIFTVKTENPKVYPVNIYDIVQFNFLAKRANFTLACGNGKIVKFTINEKQENPYFIYSYESESKIQDLVPYGDYANFFLASTDSDKTYCEYKNYGTYHSSLGAEVILDNKGFDKKMIYADPWTVIVTDTSSI